MKKLYIIALLLLSFISNAQKEEIVEIKKDTVSSMLICSNEERSKWFVIMPHFKTFDGISEMNYLTTIKTNIGKCSHKDVLVFTFVDGKYMSIRANNDWDCNGIMEVKFSLNPVKLGVLEMKYVKSIRYINGNDRSNFLYKSTKDDKNYFVRLLTK